MKFMGIYERSRGDAICMRFMHLYVILSSP